MATPWKIFVTPESSGVFGTLGLSWASARKVSEVLQHDMENHHVYFNNIGFHNHTVHFMLSIWALGASPETIQLQYDRTRQSQRPALPRGETLIRSFYDKTEFMTHMHQEEQYPNFLAFFQRQIEEKGVPDVLNEYLFAGDELGESLLSRMFAGLLHPLIHLGFGLEFGQPAIVAQALAQASVHRDYLGQALFRPATDMAATKPERKMDLLEVMEEMRAGMKIGNAGQLGDRAVFGESIMSQAGEEVIRYCSWWTVPEDQIQERLVEMINTAVYWTATAQNPQKQLKLDFFFIHAVNLSIFFKTFMDLPYLSAANKARLLEMKGRMDLLIWASGKMPQPQPDDILNYPIHLGWPEVFAKSYRHPSDDGHLAKFVRTVAFAGELCRPYESNGRLKNLPVTGDMWLQIGNLAVDSVGVIHHDLWVRGAGFEERWSNFRPRT